jgi:hypothetical protein
MATTATNKMPTNWHEQNQNMAYNITYLVKLYFIPLCLMVNNDQIKIHLVPIVGETTWESKGTKHIQVLGVEDKRQITMVVSSLANGYLFPRKVIFTSIMHKCLPPSNEGKIKCINSSWHLTFSKNH